MADAMPLSMKAWADVMGDPTDNAAWVAFIGHYWDPVYKWALRGLGRKEAAEEVAAEVFTALFRRITNGDLPPVEPNERGSFRPYIYAVVARLCVGYRRNAIRRQKLGLTLADVDRLEDRGSIGDLCDRVAAREEFELRMERSGDLFLRAVREVKAAPQYDDRTFAAFLLIARDGMRHRDVDARFGQATGWSSKSSARVRERILQRMAALDGRGPAAAAEFDAILDHLVRLHGESPP